MLLAAFAAFAIAQQASGPVETQLVANSVAIVEGKESLRPAAAVKPGETIEYRATYTNRTKVAVRNLEATLPIPAGTELLPASVNPAAAKASLDGSNFDAMPLKRVVKKDGRDAEEIVPYSEYRYLRWYPGELPGEKSLVFSARVKVSEAAPGLPNAPPAGKGK